MKQKNQKIDTFSRTKDRSGEVGEQKHGEEWKNSSENNNTFLAAVTSSKGVHAMHKTSKEQIFHKNFQKEQPIRPAFFEKEGEEDKLPAQKSKKVQKVVRFFQIDLLKGIEGRNPRQQQKGRRSCKTQTRQFQAAAPTTRLRVTRNRKFSFLQKVSKIRKIDLLI